MRQHDFSEACYYLWRNKFGDIKVADAKRLDDLKAQNARLKKLLAQSLLENEATKQALEKVVSAPPQCKLMRYMVDR